MVECFSFRQSEAAILCLFDLSHHASVHKSARDLCPSRTHVWWNASRLDGAKQLFCVSSISATMIPFTNPREVLVLRGLVYGGMHLVWMERSRHSVSLRSQPPCFRSQIRARSLSSEDSCIVECISFGRGEVDILYLCYLSHHVRSQLRARGSSNIEISAAVR